MTEPCALGAENKEAVRHTVRELAEHKVNNNQDHQRIFDLIERVRNRLPTWAVFVIAGLTALCGWLVPRH